MRVVVVGHDASDAALAKRIGQMRAEGHEVRAMSFRRDEDRPRGWDNLDLGRTHDGDFRQRLAAIARGARIASAAGLARDADIVWARNLDAGLVAVAAGAGGRGQPPLIYECLDVHDLLSGSGPRAALARTLERRVVRRARRIVVSAPHFERCHFAPRYGRTGLDLIENRLVAAGPRPQAARPEGGPLTIGWFGILRCARSLDLLLAAAEQAGNDLRVVLRGRPAARELPDLAARVASVPNVRFEGPYAPEDLPAHYAAVDLAWAGDWSQAGANSRWLLPNRLYEAGWHGVPVIAPAGTATARWARTHRTGVVLETPTSEGLLALLRGSDIARMTAAVADAPDGLFAAPPGEVSAVLDAARC